MLFLLLGRSDVLGDGGRQARDSLVMTKSSLSGTITVKSVFLVNSANFWSLLHI